MTADDSLAAARAAYEHFLRAAHTGAHARRSAARNAAFFLPQLKPGMRVLDAGCGPGSITLGLAQAVAPGETVGIDNNDEGLERARGLAAERGCSNVRFESADLNALPFDDATFDAAFTHATLQHVADPLRALRELQRVLKPGGVIGAADADFDGALYWPDDPLLSRSMDIMAAMRGDSGNARVGKQLRGLLAAAGFVETRASVVASADGEAKVVLQVGRYWSGYFTAEPFVEYAVALGVAQRAELAAISRAWARWSEHPGAFWARMWCQAIGQKPA